MVLDLSRGFRYFFILTYFRGVRRGPVQISVRGNLLENSRTASEDFVRGETPEQSPKILSRGFNLLGNSHAQPPKILSGGTRTLSRVFRTPAQPPKILSGGTLPSLVKGFQFIRELPKTPPKILSGGTLPPLLSRVFNLSENSRTAPPKILSGGETPEVKGFSIY